MSDQISCAVLPDRALLRVEGPDWRKFLQGLITQDVETLAVGEMRFGLMLTPQGRFLFDMFILGGEDGCTLDVQAAQREALAQRLLMYRLRARVEVTPVEGEVRALWGGVASLEEGRWAPDPRLPELGWRSLEGRCPGGAAMVEAEAYDRHRLALGVPDPARDCVCDKTYPIEADLDLLNGIDFHKGCFVGQETTSRMKRRGQIKTRTLPLVFEGAPPSPGSEILTVDGLRAGEVLSGCQGRAMAAVRLDRIAGPLTADGKCVHTQAPKWMTAALS